MAISHYWIITYKPLLDHGPGFGSGGLTSRKQVWKVGLVLPKDFKPLGVEGFEAGVWGGKS
jgi:hypothetical protein